ncbi:transcriptional regulator [Actinorhabdospora filicis]|uniref:Transcriptional regulator n=1 Tax=Actinorhabdospora filicis TaxID=1785913 RepID=A0A9W6STT2_9ACTN|nr:transcriptional regulator [Actinorhabdospora filicis]
MVTSSKSRGANPTVRRRSLGARLRDLREKAGVTADEAASALDVHSSTIYRIERGKVGIKPRDVKTLLDRYGIAGDQISELEGLAREGRQRGWWARYSETISPPYQTYVGLETEATYLHIYDAIIINGLLQTRRYAEATFKFAPAGDPKLIAQRIELRMERQERLKLISGGAEMRPPSDDEPTGGEPRPLQLWAVIDEAALRRMIGGKDIMEEQLAHLIEIAGYSGVTLQVLPFDGGAYPGMLGTFTILRFAGADPDVVYVEGKTGDVYEESEEQVRPYWQIFDSLRAAALSPVDTLEFLRELLREVKNS